MLINSTIFNEADNINDIIDRIKNFSPEVAEEAQEKYSNIMTKVALKEIDKSDFRDAIKENIKAGDNKNEAKQDAKISLADQTWADGSLQLWFVPYDSLLANALRDYYDYVDNNFQPATSCNFPDVFEKYPRSGVNDDNRHGFFFTTGLGYDINDDLFINVPIKNRQHPDGTGSGVPSKRFLHFLNHIDDKKLQK